jgi:dephospho-CoA kinase
MDKHNTKIVMLSGKAGSGKDTVCNYIVENYPGYRQYAFAKCLKDYVGAMYGISDTLLYTQEGKKRIINVKETKMSVRDILIMEATKKRKTDENYWVSMVIEQILKDKPENVVISDFRFPNEFYEMNKYFDDILSVNIVREDYIFIEDSSETSLDNFEHDIRIYNNSNKFDLYRKVDFILDENN